MRSNQYQRDQLQQQAEEEECSKEKKMATKRRHIANEILTTETSYVTDLEVIRKVRTRSASLLYSCLYFSDITAARLEPIESRRQGQQEAHTFPERDRRGILQHRAHLGHTPLATRRTQGQNARGGLQRHYHHHR